MHKPFYISKPHQRNHLVSTVKIHKFVFDDYYNLGFGEQYRGRNNIGMFQDRVMKQLSISNWMGNYTAVPLML